MSCCGNHIILCIQLTLWLQICRLPCLVHYINFKLMPICKPVSCVHSSGNDEHIVPICKSHKAMRKFFMWFFLPKRTCMSTEIWAKTITFLLWLRLNWWIWANTGRPRFGKEIGNIENQNILNVLNAWLMTFACCFYCHIIIIWNLNV